MSSERKKPRRTAKRGEQAGIPSRFDFDILLSFAGPEREYARAIYAICEANDLKTFLDEEFQHELWGRNLVEFLDRAYRERGAYCLALISSSYCERAYTTVERRAAFDRMIQQPAEYLLPVRIDDAWPDGLPRSTAYLDLRVHGVLGICETLLKKIKGGDALLKIPPTTRVPRVPLGQLKAEHLSRYLVDLCRHQPVTAFGVLIYDERTAEIKKLLSDRDYWDALDATSGLDLEIFAIRDKEEIESEVFTGFELLTLSSMSRSSSRHYYYSRLLKEYFGEERTRLAYPSFLLFITSKHDIEYSRLIPLPRGTVEESFHQLQTLVSKIATGIERWKASEAGSGQRLWDELKKELLSAGYTVYIQRSPKDISTAIDGLARFVEQ
jgi:hypothetical protein